MIPLFSPTQHTLQTPLTPQQCCLSMQRTMYPVFFPGILAFFPRLTARGPGDRWPAMGAACAHGFHVRSFALGIQATRPDAVGTFASAGQGTEVRVSLPRLDRFNVGLLYLCVWGWLAVYAIPTAAPALNRWLWTGTTFACLAAVYVVRDRWARAEQQRLLDFLRCVLHTEALATHEVNEAA